MLRIGRGRIAAPAPTLPREDTTSPTPPRFWAASAVDGSNPPRVVPVPTRGLGYVNGLSRAGGGHSHPPQAARRAMRIFGHASVSLATPAAFRARFVGCFWRSGGRRVRGVAKEAGRDPPAEAGGAAVTSVTKPPTPAGGSRPASETTIRYSRQPIADRRSARSTGAGTSNLTWGE